MGIHLKLSGEILAVIEPIRYLVRNLLITVFLVWRRVVWYMGTTFLPPFYGYPEDKGRRLICKFGTYLPNYMESHSKRPWELRAIIVFIKSSNSKFGIGSLRKYRFIIYAYQLKQGQNNVCLWSVVSSVLGFALVASHLQLQSVICSKWTPRLVKNKNRKYPLGKYVYSKQEYTFLFFKLVTRFNIWLRS